MTFIKKIKQIAIRYFILSCCLLFISVAIQANERKLNRLEIYCIAYNCFCSICFHSDLALKHTVCEPDLIANAQFRINDLNEEYPTKLIAYTKKRYRHLDVINLLAFQKYLRDGRSSYYFGSDLSPPFVPYA